MSDGRGGRGARVLIYLLPAMYDAIVSQTMFVNGVRAARLGVRDSVVAGTVAAFCLVYTLVCPLVGRRLRPRNASAWLLAACVGMAVCNWTLPLLGGLFGIYALAVLGAVSAACFFPAFQVFMKAVDRGGGKSVTYSTGLYTFAWSFGFALGPFVSGFLLDMGRTAEARGVPGYVWAHALAGVLALVTGAGALWFRRLVPAAGAADAAPGAAPALSATESVYAGMPDLVRVGWLGAGVGVLVLSVWRGIFPAHAQNILHLPARTQGLVFFLLSFTQALTGLALTRSRFWMYRARAVAAFGAVGAVGCFGFAVATDAATLAVAAVAMGIYSGAFFFYLVFHALTHPLHSARYVAINEAVVGIAGTVGPLAGGLLAEGLTPASPYLASVVAVVLITIWQARVHARHPVPRGAGG